MPEVNGWKFKEEQAVTFSSEAWYDLADGGYIKPHDMLSNEKDANDLTAAVELITSFLEAAEEVGVLEYT